MPAAGDMEHTTGWDVLKRIVEAHGPRSNGRRTQDGRRWWTTFVLVLLQGGFFLAWRLQFTAQQASLEEERKIRSEQHSALVQTLDRNTVVLGRLADATQGNTEALKVLLDRTPRGGRP